MHPHNFKFHEFNEIFNINADANFSLQNYVFPDNRSAADLTGWRSDSTVAGTANEFHTDFPPCISVDNYIS